jgi:hypothetical protein
MRTTGFIAVYFKVFPLQLRNAFYKALHALLPRKYARNAAVLVNAKTPVDFASFVLATILPTRMPF